MSRAPYFETDGNLVVPFDAPRAACWWKAAKGGRYGASHPENMPDVALVEAAFAKARELASDE